MSPDGRTRRSQTRGRTGAPRSEDADVAEILLRLKACRLSDRLQLTLAVAVLVDERVPDAKRRQQGRRSGGRQLPRPVKKRIPVASGDGAVYDPLPMGPLIEGVLEIVYRIPARVHGILGHQEVPRLRGQPVIGRRDHRHVLDLVRRPDGVLRQDDGTQAERRQPFPRVRPEPALQKPESHGGQDGHGENRHEAEAGDVPEHREDRVRQGRSRGNSKTPSDTCGAREKKTAASPVTVNRTTGNSISRSLVRLHRITPNAARPSGKNPRKTVLSK